MIRLDFIRVLPADVARVGGDEAIILALIRYATEYDDGRYGRTTIDGQVWWRGSYADISAITGLTYDVSRRVASKLEKAGEVTVLTTVGGGDRTRVYRLPDLPIGETATPLTCQLAEPPEGYGETARPSGETARPSGRSASCTIPMRNRDKEIKEREGADAPTLATVEPPQAANAQTANAVPAQKTPRTRKRKPATAIPDDFTVPDSEIQQILERFPNATPAAIARETFKFINHYQGNGTKRPGWLHSWRNWMANADQYGDFTSRSGNSHSDKVSAVDAAAQAALDALLGPNRAALNTPPPKEIA